MWDPTGRGATCSRVAPRPEPRILWLRRDEEENVRRCVLADETRSPNGGIRLELAHLRQALRRRDFVPDGKVEDADVDRVPPATAELSDDVAVLDPGYVRRAGSGDTGGVEHSRVVETRA